MFRNEIKNHYFDVTGSKLVLGECSKEDASGYGIDFSTPVYATLHPKLQPIISTILKKRPSWKLKYSVKGYANYPRLREKNPDCPVLVDRISFWDGDEELGWVKFGPRNGYGKYGYCFDNYRLSKTRERGSESFSESPQTAAARIIKAFHSRTPKELMEEAKKGVGSAIYGMQNSHRWKVDREYDRMRDEILSYVCSNWGELRSTLDPRGICSDGFPDMVSAQREVASMDTALKDGHARIVKVESSGRYLAQRVGCPVETYTQDTLPQGLALNLTLLKMLPQANDITAGVGMKFDKEVYLVLDREDSNG